MYIFVSSHVYRHLVFLFLWGAYITVKIMLLLEESVFISFVFLSSAKDKNKTICHSNSSSTRNTIGRIWTSLCVCVRKLYTIIITASISRLLTTRAVQKFIELIQRWRQGYEMGIIYLSLILHRAYQKCLNTIPVSFMLWLG